MRTTENKRFAFSLRKWVKKKKEDKKRRRKRKKNLYPSAACRRCLLCLFPLTPTSFFKCEKKSFRHAAPRRGGRSPPMTRHAANQEDRRDYGQLGGSMTAADLQLPTPTPFSIQTGNPSLDLMTGCCINHNYQTFSVQISTFQKLWRLM